MRGRPHRPGTRGRLGWLLCLAALLAAGCGKTTAQVSGKVTYRGRPVTSGAVTFLGKDGKAGDTGQIQADGSYVVARAPVGPVTIAVVTPPPPDYSQAASQGGSLAADEEVKAGLARAARHVAVPAKYRNPQESGLTFEVRPGPNAHDIDLK
jgi:hypothetical protein